MPVFNLRYPAKPIEFRLVYDAAAQHKGVSLNSMLLSGPDLVVPVVNGLVRVMTNPVAICGDPKDVWHGLCVREGDWSVQQMSWWYGKLVADDEVCRLMFGVTCYPSSAQFVKRFAAQHLTEWQPLCPIIVAMIGLGAATLRRRWLNWQLFR